MLDITNVEVTGWEAAIRGMRNPMNSWNKSVVMGIVTTLLELAGTLTLLEHEAAVWLDREHLDSVKWLPADYSIFSEIEALLL